MISRNFKDPKYNTWRSAVFKRDKYKCIWPGCKNKKKLNAHHIRRWADYPSLQYMVRNGCTLCETHHKRIKGHEETYAPLFIRIISGVTDEQV